MEFIKKNPKLFQWLFLLIVFFALCFAIDVPETYKFIRGQAEFIKYSLDKASGKSFTSYLP